MTGGALVVGEALIDEVVDGGSVSRHPGGSPANVALGLARLGVATRLHTAIGDDEDGALIRRHLGGSGVGLTPESVTPAPTSKAVATLAADGSATYRFALTWAPAPLRDLGSPAVVHTGSIGAFLEPGAEVALEVVEQGRSQGALVSFDPNIRPSLLPDPGAVRELHTRLAAAAHLVKLSDEDAGYLYPGTPLEDVLDLLVGAGAGVAAITRGGAGALLASGGERLGVDAIRTTVADTVGAGDTFMAALIWALVFDGPGWDGGPVTAGRLRAAGETAAHAAAITVSRPGADLPRLADIRPEGGGR
ncbi:carbohydrate kinase [Leifsonia sp. C5G2]|uniref:carbohydrate kinase family protein n=1 Tax=Leifsonia sp. C5G2 TaxID=2735269 RepID=UPI0032DFC1B1